MLISLLSGFWYRPHHHRVFAPSDRALNSMSNIVLGRFTLSSSHQQGHCVQGGAMRFGRASFYFFFLNALLCVYIRKGRSETHTAHLELPPSHDFRLLEICRATPWQVCTGRFPGPGLCTVDGIPESPSAKTASLLKCQTQEPPAAYLSLASHLDVLLLPVSRLLNRPGPESCSGEVGFLFCFFLKPHTC